MLLIRAVLLWAVISLHVVGGAVAFRRLFPRESPWFGFIVPALVFIVVMNFTEHLVAIPSLLWLLPFTTSGCIWCLCHPKMNWRGLRLPTAIFLGSFAFTLTLRALTPDICATRDGIPDLALLSSFLQGDKLPPRLCWDPDLPLARYYIMVHYAMSVLTRFLGVDIGTGFNLSSALLSGFDFFLAAAAAWRISRKLWITLLAPFLMASAATGATAYMWFTVSHLDPNGADDIFSGFDDPNNHSPLLKLIHDHCRYELVPPGAWAWIGSVHATCGGLFLVLFFVLAVIEVLRRKATDWPWICLGVVPLLTIVTSTWGVPVEGLMLVGALGWIFYLKLFPRSFRFVLLGLGLATALMLAVVTEFLLSATFTGVEWTVPDCRIQRNEYLVLWWPIYLPFVALLFAWPKLSPALKTIMISLFFALVGADVISTGGRYDWIGKLWCFIYGAAWITLLPALFMRRGIFFRILSFILFATSICSFGAWGEHTWAGIDWFHHEELHLEGTGPFRQDPVLSRMLENMSRIRGKIILTSKSSGGGSPPLGAFSGNLVYIAWYSDVNVLKSGSPAPELTTARAREVDDFYEGKCEHPLLFLRSHDISAVAIYPDDKIETKILDNLKKSLAPYYDYVDCQGDKVNAGIFFFHPEMMKWPPDVIMPTSVLTPPPASSIGQ